MRVCVCFACYAYLAGPHLQQGQRTWWFVACRCWTASSSACPAAGNSWPARTRRRRGRGSTRALGEACVVQMIEPLCIACRFCARRTLIACRIVRGCSFWRAPESLEAQFAPFFLFLQRTINRRKSISTKQSSLRCVCNRSFDWLRYSHCHSHVYVF